MICRDVLESRNLDACGGFDFFNDYNDTHNWLLREAQCHEDPVKRSDAAELAEELFRRNEEYLKQHWEYYYASHRQP